MKKGSTLIYWTKVASLGLMLGLGLQFAQAWVAPTAAPPGGNVAGPLTTSAAEQVKLGTLELGGLRVRNDVHLATSVGNVGIGTIAPSQKLSVNGNIETFGAGNGIIFPDGTKQTTAAVGGGSGSVTRVETGAGLAGGPITGSGTISLDLTGIASCTGADQNIVWDAVNRRFKCEADDGGSDWTDLTLIPKGAVAAGCGWVAYGNLQCWGGARVCGQPYNPCRCPTGTQQYVMEQGWVCVKR